MAKGCKVLGVSEPIEPVTDVEEPIPGRKYKRKPALARTTREILRLVERDKGLTLPPGAISQRLRELGRAQVEKAMPYIGRIAANRMHTGEKKPELKESIAAYAVLARHSLGDITHVLMEDRESLKLFATVLGRQLMRSATELVLIEAQEDRVKAAEQLYREGMAEIEAALKGMTE